MSDYFWRELEQIRLGNPVLDLVTLSNPPHSYGWLRRSEFDPETAQAWERPDGVLCSIVPEGGTEHGSGYAQRRSAYD